LRFSNNVKWYKIKLGEILKIKSGMDQKKVECENGIYNIYGTGGIIGKTNIPLYSKKSVGIGRKGTIDKPFYFDEPFWTVDTLFYSEIKSHSPKFLYYLFQTINWKYYNQSTGVPSLTSSVIENIAVYVPNSDDEEIKIADFLDLVEKRITTQKKIIDKYKSLIKWINDKHFSNIKTYIKFSELYTLAKEGGTPDTKKESYYLNGNIPFIKIDDLYSKYITKHKNHISIQGLHNSSAWIIPENSVIYSNGATIGEVSINTYPVATKQGILGIIPNDLISSEYFYYLLKSKYFKKEICKITTKGTMDAAYIKDIDKISCPVAIKKHQIIYTTKINNLFNKIEMEKKILYLYEKQKQYLLNKLFI